MIRRVLTAASAAVLAASALSPAPAGAAGRVQQVISPAGVAAWLMEDRLNPVITMRFAFRGGAALDPEGKEGLANFAAALMDEGAAERGSQAFRRELEDKSVTLSYDAGLDSFRGRLRTLTKHADAAFGLLGDSLTQPRFDEEPVERIRRQILAGLRQDEESPGAQAGRALFEHLFKGHPYARPADGTLETVAGLTRGDLQAFARRLPARNALVIGVAGDVTPERLGVLLDKAFAGLPAEQGAVAGAAEIRDVEPRLDGEMIVIEKDVPQSTVMFADMGLKRSDPDFYAAYVMAHILGGGSFTSRLYSEVREKRGLAYSVGGYLYPFDHAGLTLGQSSTQNRRAAEAVEVIRAEWRRMAEGGVTAAELEAAKLFLTGSYPLRFTGNGAVAEMLMGLQLDGLPMDYFDIRNSLIEAVTAGDIARAARRLLDPERMVFAVAGKPEGLPGGGLF